MMELHAVEDLVCWSPLWYVTHSQGGEPHCLPSQRVTCVANLASEGDHNSKTHNNILAGTRMSQEITPMVCNDFRNACHSLLGVAERLPHTCVSRC